MALPAAALPVLPAYRNVSTLTMRELTLETRDEDSTIAFCKAVSVLSAASMCLTIAFNQCGFFQHKLWCFPLSGNTPPKFSVSCIIVSCLPNCTTTIYQCYASFL